MLILNRLFHSPPFPSSRAVDSSEVESMNIAPASTARLTRSESRMLRFIAMSEKRSCEDDAEWRRLSIEEMESNGNSNTIPDLPAIFTPRTTSAFAATIPEMPRGSKKSQHFGLMQSPQIFSRGNFALSQSNTRIPSRARIAAHEAPAGPAPAMTTSK